VEREIKIQDKIILDKICMISQFLPKAFDNIATGKRSPLNKSRR